MIHVEHIKMKMFDGAPRDGHSLWQYSLFRFARGVALNAAVVPRANLTLRTRTRERIDKRSENVSADRRRKEERKRGRNLFRPLLKIEDRLLPCILFAITLEFMIGANSWIKHARAHLARRKISPRCSPDLYRVSPTLTTKPCQRVSRRKCSINDGEVSTRWSSLKYDFSAERELGSFGGGTEARSFPILRHRESCTLLYLRSEIEVIPSHLYRFVRRFFQRENISFLQIFYPLFSFAK